MTTMDAKHKKLIEAVKRSKKYRDLALPDDFLVDLIQTEALTATSGAVLEDKFREKLHNVIAPYLETTDYAYETERLLASVESLKVLDARKAWALSVLQLHASTRERIPYLDEFVGILKEQLGSVHRILDLACALDPLLLPFFEASEQVEFLAYDLHKPRLQFLSVFFSCFYPQAQAIQQDILVQVPCESADCALLLKEAHRLEKRNQGCLSALFTSLNAKCIVVSLPSQDLTGHHSLLSYHRALIDRAIQGRNWDLQTAQAGPETLYFIRKDL